MSFETQAQDIARNYAAQAPAMVGDPISDPALIMIGKTIVGLRERLNDSLMRVTTFVNRAAGVEPAGPETASNAPPSDGLLDDIRAELRRVDGLVQGLAAQADRLERIA